MIKLLKRKALKSQVENINDTENDTDSFLSLMVFIKIFITHES